ncbi:sporulation integral membrane protein YlbJ [Ectobacillus sp. JY-23]|uniref:sporulation integral membrane protein YlbJ n=1 Tax=Ectobacillus sp. JY-23 TaxID=2933872 RepID=UPI001FF1BB25|nr:sporulation integral membrane protein YlbJ [Ectobacillus sp. JY-23]UOY93748.1 sporulation integral membrane protein YlbJ [Ectobacillus sp. JY-23]
MRSKIQTVLMAGTISLLTASLITNPQACLEASVRGLDMWWKVVFPSLLPFFIASELLIGLGVVNFIGVLLEPFMRPLFRVPGTGGFVWAMGMASGFPSGAKLSARLRQTKQMTQIEAERLVSFTNSSNPLFIFGAVSVGFFANAKLGILLAAAHYISNLLVGLMMRFHGHKEEASRDKKQTASLQKAFSALHRKRLEDTRPIGKMIGDAISSSVQTLLMIGGFIILFSVLNKMLSIIQFTTLFSYGIEYILHTLHVSTSLSAPILAGIFEITLGNQLTSQAQAPLLHQAMIASFILAFSGLSVQAQVASILAETDIRFKPYFIARVVQSLIAPILTLILWKPLYEKQSTHIGAIPVVAQPAADTWHVLYTYGPAMTLFCLYVYVLLLVRKI